jgi:homogentisate 1,2-dioxygenase
MFETRHVLRPSATAMALPRLQTNYQDSWLGLKNNFNTSKP